MQLPKHPSEAVDDEGITRQISKSTLHKCLELVLGFYKRKLYVSPHSYIGVMLYNTASLSSDL